MLIHPSTCFFFIDRPRRHTRRCMIDAHPSIHLFPSIDRPRRHACRCTRLGLICQEQLNGPGRPLGQGSLAFKRPKDEVYIYIQAAVDPLRRLATPTPTTSIDRSTTPASPDLTRPPTNTQTTINDFLPPREEEDTPLAPSAPPPCPSSLGGNGSSGGHGGHGRGEGGFLHAGPVYEPKRCAEVVAAKFAQLMADEAVQTDKALAVL